MSKAMIATVTRMAILAELIPNLEQLKRHIAANSQRLADDLAVNGQHQPIGILADKRIIFGHGRYAAAKLLGWKEIEAKIYPDSLTETQWLTIRATENLLRNELSGYMRWQLCLELLKLNPTWCGRDLAQNLHIDGGMVTRYLSPDKLISEAKAALKEERITLSACYELSKVPEAEQVAMLAAALNGATRSGLQLEGRKRRNGTPATTVRMDRCKIAMPQGASVVVSGKELGMNEVVELLSETLKAAKKAAATFDISTFQAMMADQAKT